MKSAQSSRIDDLSPNIGTPATRALAEAGITRLEQLTSFSEAELLKLHGVGPKAIRLLREALSRRRLKFARPAALRSVSDGAKSRQSQLQRRR